MTRAAIAALVLALVAAAEARARAQGASCVAMAGCADGCACDDDACIARQCGGDDGGGGNQPSAAELEAEMARRERDFQTQLAASHAIASAEAQAAEQADNREGISAYQRHQWKAAVSYFEQALLLDPGDAQVQANLASALAAERLELHARAATAGPVLPSLHGDAVVIADRIPTELTPARPEVTDYLQVAFDYFREESTARATATARQLLFDLSTPWGLPLRVAANEVQLARDLPDWIMRAARGEMSLDEASTLDRKGAAMVINVGGAPGRFLHDVVELRSGGAAALKEGERRLEGPVDAGVEKLGARVGAPALVTQAYELGKSSSATIWKWVGR